MKCGNHIILVPLTHVRWSNEFHLLENRSIELLDVHNTDKLPVAESSIVAFNIVMLNVDSTLQAFKSVLMNDLFDEHRAPYISTPGRDQRRIHSLAPGASITLLSDTQIIFWVNFLFYTSRVYK